MCMASSVVCENVVNVAAMRSSATAMRTAAHEAHVLPVVITDGLIVHGTTGDGEASNGSANPAMKKDTR